MSPTAPTRQYLRSWQDLRAPLRDFLIFLFSVAIFAVIVGLIFLAIRSHKRRDNSRITTRNEGRQRSGIDSPAPATIDDDDFELASLVSNDTPEVGDIAVSDYPCVPDNRHSPFLRTPLRLSDHTAEGSGSTN